MKTFTPDRQCSTNQCNAACTGQGHTTSSATILSYKTNGHETTCGCDLVHSITAGCTSNEVRTNGTTYLAK